MSLRSFSFGGGVQSTAALVLAARGEIDYPLFLYANVGDDHEPETLEYVHRVAMPYAVEHGIELVEVTRGGKNPSVLAKVQRQADSGKPMFTIPVRMDRSGKPGRRSCTYDYKITPIARELKRRGASVDEPAVVGLGISVDEVQRVRSPVDPSFLEQRREYPLVDLGLTRQDCRNVISGAGVEIPPKSACYFCPFHSLEQWHALKRSRPDLFERSVQLEKMMQRRRREHDHDPVWLTDLGARHRLTLDQLVHDQLTLDDENIDNCDEGFCFT